MNLIYFYQTHPTSSNPLMPLTSFPSQTNVLFVKSTISTKYCQYIHGLNMFVWTYAVYQNQHPNDCDSSSPQTPSIVHVSSVSLSLREFLPDPCWNVSWFHLVQVLNMQPQSVWVHVSIWTTAMINVAW